MSLVIMEITQKYLLKWAVLAFETVIWNEKCSYNHLVTSWWHWFRSFGWCCLAGWRMSLEGRALGAHSLTLLVVCPLCFEIMLQDVRSQLPVCHLMAYLPVRMDSYPSGIIRSNRLFPLFAFGHSALSRQ